MLDPLALEETFNNLLTHLPQKAPDGIIDVNVDLLKSLNLLDVEVLESQVFFASSAEQFYMVEAEEKLTLFNQEFAIWMLPSFTDDESATYVFIARNFEDAPPELEIVFLARGVYNTSWLVLSVLDAFLQEVKENETVLSKLFD